MQLQSHGFRVQSEAYARQEEVRQNMCATFLSVSNDGEVESSAPKPERRVLQVTPRPKDTSFATTLASVITEHAEGLAATQLGTLSMQLHDLLFLSTFPHRFILACHTVCHQHDDACTDRPQWVSVNSKCNNISGLTCLLACPQATRVVPAVISSCLPCPALRKRPGPIFPYVNSMSHSCYRSIGVARWCCRPIALVMASDAQLKCETSDWMCVN